MIKPKNDMQTFQSIYDDYYRALVAYAYTFVGSSDAAEDVVQEVFMTIWESDNEYPNQQQLTSFLYRTIHHKCIDLLRHEKTKETNQQRLTIHNEMLLTDEEYASEDIYRQLFNVIDQLPEKQRAVILLTLEGKTLKEIAESLSITYETAKTHKKRALAYLRAHLDKEALLILNCIIFQM